MVVMAAPCVAIAVVDVVVVFYCFIVVVDVVVGVVVDATV